MIRSKIVPIQTFTYAMKFVSLLWGSDMLSDFSCIAFTKYLVGPVVKFEVTKITSIGFPEFGIKNLILELFIMVPWVTLW